MKKALFYFLIVLFIALGFYFKPYFSLFYFQSDYNKSAINIEATQNIGNVYVCYNKNCEFAKYKNNIYSHKLNEMNIPLHKNKIKEIEIVANDFSKIKAISVFSGAKLKYYSKNDIQKMQKGSFELENYSTVELYGLNFEKNLLQKFSVWFMSLFYCWYFYIFLYVLLAFKMPKLKIKYPFLWIFLLGAALRFSHIDFVPLWNDELYTLCVISDAGKNILKNTMFDPGNPPLFFILSNLWLYFFNKSVIAVRLLPYIISLVQIYSFYFVVKKILDKKTALIASFLNAVNIFVILESNEIRSYILSMTLVLWGGYYFYKLNNDFSKKNLSIYFLINILLINCHYYSFLFVLSNLILGLLIFKNNRKKFAFLNFVALLTFLPYFFKTFINKSLDSGFNTWIGNPGVDTYLNIVTFFFGNVVFFILTILFCIFVYKKYLQNKQERKIFLYSAYTVVCVLILATIISLFKSILCERYFSIFIPLLIINTAILLNIDYKTKFQNLIIVLIFLFSVNMPKYENYNLFNNIDTMINYAISDSKNLDKKYSYYLVIPDTAGYAKYYKNLPKNNFFVSTYGVREDENILKFFFNKVKDKRPVVIYLSEGCINTKIKYSRTLDIKKIHAFIIPIYKLTIN